MTQDNSCEACGGNGLEPNFYDPLGPIGSSSLNLGEPSFCLTCSGRGEIRQCELEALVPKEHIKVVAKGDK